MCNFHKVMRLISTSLPTRLLFVCIDEIGGVLCCLRLHEVALDDVLLRSIGVYLTGRCAQEH